MGAGRPVVSWYNGDPTICSLTDSDTSLLGVATTGDGTGSLCIHFLHAQGQQKGAQGPGSWRALPPPTFPLSPPPPPGLLLPPFAAPSSWPVQGARTAQSLTASAGGGEQELCP